MRGLRLALLFSALVVSIIIFSFFLRAYEALRGSTFDSFRYNVLLRSENPQVVSFSNSEDEDTKIEVVDFSKTPQELNVYLPVSAVIETRQRLDPENFKSDFSSLLFKAKSNVPLFDRVKIALFVAKTDLSQNTKFLDSSEFSAAQVEAFFRDPAIARENISIQIVNDSGAPGLGNRLANVVATLGGNVVLVTSDDKPKEKSVIQYRADSLTLKFLSTYLGYSTKKMDLPGVADIVIILGEDSATSVKY